MADHPPNGYKDKDGEKGDDISTPKVTSEDDKNVRNEKEEELFGTISQSSDSFSDTELEKKEIENPTDIVVKKDAKQEVEKGQSSSTQAPSSHGPYFPCDKCSQSYWSHESLQRHVKKRHIEKGSSFDCVYCFDTFSSKEARRKHEKIAHAEDLVDDNRKERNERRSLADLKRKLQKDDCKKAHSANKCPDCLRSFVTKAGMLGHRRNFHKSAGTSVKSQKAPASHGAQDQHGSSSLQCSTCDKKFSNADFLKKHMSTSHLVPSDIFCDTCGEVFNSRQELISHEKTCREDTQNSGKAGKSDEKTRSADISDRNQSFTLKDTPKREHDPDYGRGVVVKTEPENVSMDPQYSIRKPFRASTQSVWRGLGPGSGSINPQSSYINRASPLLQLENGSSMVGHQDKPSMTSPSCSSGGLTVVSRRPAGVPSSDAHEDKITKSSLPLTAAIFARSVQEPDKLMIVWAENFERDLVEAVSQNPGNAILCVRQLNTFSLKTAEMELLKTSKAYNFTLTDNNDTFILWTVITFGDGHAPVGIESRQFRRLTDAEKMFAEHARDRGMILNNVMRGDGFYPFLEENLKGNIRAYNVKPN